MDYCKELKKGVTSIIMAVASHEALGYGGGRVSMFERQQQCTKSLSQRSRHFIRE